MRYSRLSDVCSLVSGKIMVQDLTLENYISTENMLQNKGGITKSSGLPTTLQTQEYVIGDVLVSNIRPYFKKIWLANRKGGCSNDVLVFRAKGNMLPEFLYYLLSNDKFFEYTTQTAKGTKMPRGDKNAIMKFEIPNIDIDSQRKIVEILLSIDGKIELNNKINDNLCGAV